MGIVIYRLSHWVFYIVQKPWNWIHILVQKPQCAGGGGSLLVKLIPTRENRNGCVDKSIRFLGLTFCWTIPFLAVLIITKIIDQKENNNWWVFRKLRLRKQRPKTLKTKTLKNEKTETLQ